MKTKSGYYVKRSALIGLAAISAAVGANAALADSTSQYRTQTVSFRGLDLTSTEGAEIAYKRIRHAAKIVCAGPDTTPWELREYHRCFDATVAKAVDEANVPMLTQLHDKNKVPRLARN